MINLRFLDSSIAKDRGEARKYKLQPPAMEFLLNILTTHVLVKLAELCHKCKLEAPITLISYDIEHHEVMKYIKDIGIELRGTARNGSLHPEPTVMPHRIPYARCAHDEPRWNTPTPRLRYETMILEVPDLLLLFHDILRYDSGYASLDNRVQYPPKAFRNCQQLTWERLHPGNKEMIKTLKKRFEENMNERYYQVPPKHIHDFINIRQAMGHPHGPWEPRTQPKTTTTEATTSMVTSTEATTSTVTSLARSRASTTAVIPKTTTSSSSSATSTNQHHSTKPITQRQCETLVNQVWPKEERDLRELQRKDAKWGRYIAILEGDTSIPSLTLTEIGVLKFRDTTNGPLMLITNHEQDHPPLRRICLPESLLKPSLYMQHDLAGHPDSAKTMTTI
jgi:hypothetical protein